MTPTSRRVKKTSADVFSHNTQHCTPVTSYAVQKARVVGPRGFVVTIAENTEYFNHEYRFEGIKFRREKRADARRQWHTVWHVRVE